MNSVLTTQAREKLTAVIAGSLSSITVPQYLEIASGTGSVLPSDECTSGPIFPRLPCNTSRVTTQTVNDTFRASFTYIASVLTNITNIGLFDTSTSAPQGTTAQQINFSDTTFKIYNYNNFPNSFPFDIQIGSEVMTVTSGNGLDTWTVTRATNGSLLTLNGIPLGTQILGGFGTSNGNMFLKSSFPEIRLETGFSVEFIIDIEFV